METDTVKLRKYLLGSLPENEAEEFDLQVIGSESFTEELYLAEDALIEDYLDESLSAEESELFHRNFLISEERKNQVKEIAALKSYARNFRLKENSGNAPKGFFQNFGRPPFFSFRPLTVVFASLLLIGFIGFVLWQSGLVGSADEIALLENETAILNRQDLSDLSRFENTPKLSLIPGVMRNTEETGKLSVAGLSDNVLIRLALPREENAESFNAKIIRNQKDSLSLSALPAYRNQSGKEIRMLVSSEFLKPGEYKIELLPEKSKEFPINYSFSVQRAEQERN